MSDRVNDFLAGDQGADPNDPWEDVPVELGRQPAPLPTDALGPILGPLTVAVESAYQVSGDLVTNLALPIIATAVQGRRVVRINRDWSETIALASLSALASGERKSPVLRLLDAALREFERAARDEAAPRIVEQQTRLKLAEDRAETLRKEAVKASGYEQLERENAYIEARRELAEMVVEPFPRLIVDDITPEQLDRVLGDHGAIGAISAEPGLFSIIAGRYSNGSPNVENILKATSGDSYTVDRVSRDGDPIRVDRPALSIAMCIQPARLGELSATAVFRAAGLLARLIYVLPAARVGTREIRPEMVPGHLVTSWAEHLAKLAAAGSTDDLGLSYAAAEMFHQFRAQLEPMLHPQHGRLSGIADLGSKLPGTVARIAAVLELLSNPDAAEITETTMANAIRLGWGYVDHALAAFAVIYARSDDLGHAREVLGWLRAHIPGKHAQKDQNPDSAPEKAGSGDIGHAFAVFTLRDVWAALKGRSWAETAEDIRAAITVLVERGHVRRLKNLPGPGRPSERYQLHPSHLAESGHPEPEPPTTTTPAGTPRPRRDPNRYA